MKNKLVKWWKGLDHWKKGAIIGLVIGLFSYPLPIIVADIVYDNDLFVSFIWYVFAFPFCTFLKHFDCSMIYLVYGWIYTTILGIFIGSLVGILIKKFKK